MQNETQKYDYVPRFAEPIITPIVAIKKIDDEEIISSTTNKTAMPKNLSLAIAYIAFQESLEMYSPDDGLERGTLFPELFKPFTGKRGVLE